MKNFIGILFILVAVNGQDKVTDTLIRQQEDLTLGHRFFEMNIIQSRDELSDAIYADSYYLIKSHLDAVATIRQIETITNMVFDQIVVTPETEFCIAAAKRRWDLQVHRFGHQLSGCIDVSRRRERDLLMFFLLQSFLFSGFIGWNNFLNSIHSTGHLSTNQVQNAGISVLSEIETFFGPWDVPRAINNRFRRILVVTQPYLNLYTEFLEAISEGREDAILQLTECDRDLIYELTYASSDDVTRALNCVAEFSE